MDWSCCKMISLNNYKIISLPSIFLMLIRISADFSEYPDTHIPFFFRHQVKTKTSFQIVGHLQRSFLVFHYINIYDIKQTVQ